MKEPRVKQNITIHFMNGDYMECPGVWSSSENQDSLELVYKTFHTHYPMCNIKSIIYR